MAQRIFVQDSITIHVQEKKKNILKTKKGNYGSFNAHFAEMNHINENGWENRLIDQLNKVELKKKGSFFWQHEMNTF